VHLSSVDLSFPLVFNFFAIAKCRISEQLTTHFAVTAAFIMTDVFIHRSGRLGWFEIEYKSPYRQCNKIPFLISIEYGYE